MKRSFVVVAVVIATQSIIAGPVSAFECKVCHSKNPAMVRMHRELQGRDCFGCHRVGERLMGKSQPKDRDSLLKRRLADPACTGCHKS